MAPKDIAPNVKSATRKLLYAHPRHREIMESIAKNKNPFGLERQGS